MVDRDRVISCGCGQGSTTVKGEHSVLSPHIADYSQVMQFDGILFHTTVTRQLNCVCSLHFNPDHSQKRQFFKRLPQHTTTQSQTMSWIIHIDPLEFALVTLVITNELHNLIKICMKIFLE